MNKKEYTALPQSASLTAPSEKEPDIALSVLRTALPEGEPRKITYLAHSICGVCKGADTRAEIVDINHFKLG